MARTVQITFDCADPARVGEFWAAALGYVPDPPPAGFDTWPDALRAFGVPEEDWTRAFAVIDPAGAGPRIFFQRVPEAKAGKNRLHLDVRVGQAGEERSVAEAAVLAEAERLEALGAHRVEWRDDLDKRFMVMTDVEGNEFCLT